MSKIKLFDLIKQLLTEKPELRDSDKKLIWAVWNRLGLTDINSHVYDCIHADVFIFDAPSTESCRRCRQKIQEHFPELRSSKKVQEMKDQKEATKSTFVYREPVQEALV